MTRHIGKVLKNTLFILLVSSLLLASCSSSQKTQVAEATDAVPTLVPTATPEPAKKLVICLGEEPQSLYLYGGSSQAMWSVLEAIYDGPIDTRNNVAEPVILNELPTLENGGVTLQSVAVSRGDKIANTAGDVVALEKGVRVFPEGCSSPTCAVEWDGTSELKVVQMTAVFSLLPDLKWSDGQPLTAADSVYSYQLSADPATNVSKNMLERTADYQAVDDQTVKWTGIPGYLTLRPANVFWIPQPKHLMENLTAEELNSADLTNRSPVGWGAYQIAEWTAGEQIRLIKNPNYFKASEGLPKFDEVVYKFLSALPDADLSPMTTGECDIMDPSTGLEDQIQSVRELELAGELTSYFGQGPSWEALNFGISPSSYDDVFNIYIDRPDFFSDIKTRQAFAYCIDRQKIITDVLFSQSQVPATYLPSSNPLAVTDWAVIEHDPEKGNQLLDEVGWKDLDNDPSTPRTSLGISTVLNDKPFAITYTLTDTPLHEQVAEIVVSSLKECGVDVTIQYLPTEEFLAAGPEGLLFGRNFDLAELAWSSGNVPPCFLYTSSEIPTEENFWLGTKYGGVNLTGYSNADYDAACSDMLNAGLDVDTLDTNNQITQQLLANDLPMLPLFYHLKAMVARTDLCGLSLDTSSRSALDNIENLEISPTCVAD